MVRIYLDTSVFGGYFEPEFEKWSIALFDKIFKQEFRVIFSEVLDGELENAPEKVRKLAIRIPDSTNEYVSLTDQAIYLAEQYIKEGVVGKTSRADCFHIAIATLNNVDVLVSWNFKHIVNFKRIRGYNSVNYKLGHKILDIRTPREILDYEE
ncbi:MAG: hypothetical protein K8R54_12555 [Bacteroidales bacterium]|nr:hypothetical protein [Bacteroidales bacterium]